MTVVHTEASIASYASPEISFSHVGVGLDSKVFWMHSIPRNDQGNSGSLS